MGKKKKLTAKKVVGSNNHVYMTTVEIADYTNKRHDPGIGGK